MSGKTKKVNEIDKFIDWAFSHESDKRKARRRIRKFVREAYFSTSQEFEKMFGFKL